MAVRRQEVGYDWSVSSVGGIRNSVGDDLYRDTAGNCGTVGGVTLTI